MKLMLALKIASGLGDFKMVFALKIASDLGDFKMVLVQMIILMFSIILLCFHLFMMKKTNANDSSYHIRKYKDYGFTSITGSALAGLTPRFCYWTANIGMTGPQH